MSSFEGLSIADLPMPLGQSLAAQADGLGKRERTRRQLLLAAVQVFSARGVAGATIQEIANWNFCNGQEFYASRRERNRIRTAIQK